MSRSDAVWTTPISHGDRWWRACGAGPGPGYHWSHSVIAVGSVIAGPGPGYHWSHSVIAGPGSGYHSSHSVIAGPGPGYHSSHSAIAGPGPEYHSSHSVIAGPGSGYHSSLQANYPSIDGALGARWWPRTRLFEWFPNATCVALRWLESVCSHVV